MTDPKIFQDEITERIFKKAMKAATGQHLFVFNDMPEANILESFKNNLYDFLQNDVKQPAIQFTLPERGNVTVVLDKMKEQKNALFGSSDLKGLIALAMIEDSDQAQHYNFICDSLVAPGIKMVYILPDKQLIKNMRDLNSRSRLTIHVDAKKGLAVL